MQRTDTIVIGGGQAGLAMSRCLADRGIDHVVLERGRVAERWRSERWDSLRLLTPNWQSRLPGWTYRGPDPDGYMTMPEVVSYLDGYARSFAAPVRAATTVRAVEPVDGGYRVLTDRGTWSARAVVIATGQCGSPFVPAASASLSPSTVQIVPSRYRRPDDLPDGGVLVVGASASGVQLAEEIHRSGRPVTLAVGRHIRLPRLYRGMDIMWWLDTMGALSEGVDDVRDLEASRRQPSLQLIGDSRRRSLDLATLRRDGVRLVGRVLGARGSTVRLADDLAETTASADRKLQRLLRRIDRFAARGGLARALPEPEPLEPVGTASTPASIDLAAEGIGCVVWATGFRRSYPWLRVPVLDAGGEIRHAGGLTPADGLYVLGLQFLRRRNSNFIDGVGHDAAALAAHVARRLDRARGAVA